MTGTSLMHPYRGAREPSRQGADAAGVVQMDVREHDVGERVGRDPELVECACHGLDGRSGAGLHQRRLVRVEEVRGGVPFAPAHERVDGGDTECDFERDRFHGRESTEVASGRVGARW